MILSCNSCDNSYEKEAHPVFLPCNPNRLCPRCNEKELCEYMAKELIFEFDKLDREAIRMEKEKINNRFEILDL